MNVVFQNVQVNEKESEIVQALTKQKSLLSERSFGNEATAAIAVARQTGRRCCDYPV